MDKRFWVGPGKGGENVWVERGTDKYNLNAVQLPVSGEDGKVERLILGRTHFRLDVEADRLTLTPTANQPVFIQASEGEQPDEKLTEEERKAKAAQAKLDEEKAIKDMADRGIFPNYKVYDWIGDSLGKKPSMVNLLLAFAITVFLTRLAIASRQEGHVISHVGRLLGIGITLLLLVLAVLLAGVGGFLGALLFLAWIGVLWATLMQFMAGRLQGNAARIWLLAMSLAGIGLLVLAQLAVGADSTRWLAYPTDAAFWLIQMTGWVALLALVPVSQILKTLMKLFDPEYRVHVLGWTLPHPAYVLLLGVVLGLLVVQGGAGSEEGVWGVQPVELAKLVFVVASARLLWFWQHHRSLLTGYYRENWLWIGASLLIKILVALMLGILILKFGVQDNSPIFIVLCLSMALLWPAFVDPLAVRDWGKWWWRATFIGLPLLVFLGLAVWVYFVPPSYDSLIPQPERLRIWSNPVLYPEAAAQLLNSLQRVGDGGWWGTGWFGKNGVVMTIPAVQDDFIAAFMLNRFGSFSGIVLVTVQFLWLLALFRLSASLLSIETHTYVASACRLMGYVLYGLAWLHLLHWLVSWGNVLGLLPIMGQPMTWLSAGNSHLVAVGIPTLGLALLASWVLQEMGEE
jgi:cell division protein FtsW (lipid II flippase)